MLAFRFWWFFGWLFVLVLVLFYFVLLYPEKLQGNLHFEGRKRNVLQAIHGGRTNEGC